MHSVEIAPAAKEAKIVSALQMVCSLKYLHNAFRHFPASFNFGLGKLIEIFGLFWRFFCCLVSASSALSIQPTMNILEERLVAR